MMEIISVTTAQQLVLLRALFEEYWQSDEGTELYHFIGKDISYFHTLFWPAVPAQPLSVAQPVILNVCAP